MKQIKFAVAALVGLAAITSCSDDFEYNVAEDGTVVFATSFSNDVKVVSRASAEELYEQLNESAVLWISKANGDSKDGVVRKFNGLNTIPVTGVSLAGGNYVAELWAGDSVPASFDKKYYKASVPFSVTGGNAVVDIVGRIANVVTSVKFDASVDEVLSDYTMTISHARGSLTFTDPETQKGYFMMPSTDKNLTYTLTGKKNDGTQFTRTGVIENAKPCTEYILSVKYTATTEEIGGGMLDIVINTSEVAINDDIIITLPPKIQGYGFDIASPIYSGAGAVGRRSVYISAATSLTDVVVTSDILTPIIGGNDINLFTASSAVKSTLIAGGVNWAYEYDSAHDLSNIKINFEESLLNSLDNGDYTIKFEATDAYGKSSTAVMTISTSEAKIIAQAYDAESADNWATEVVLAFDIVDEEATNLGAEYRAVGDSNWTYVAGTRSRAASNTYTVKITGLTPGKTYEYRPVCDGFVGVALQFTTENDQIPNNGFENWQTSSSPYLLYGSGQEMFWDSGNHGSATMKKNVTYPDTSVKHSGSYSALLASQFVGIGSIGKFAAGNCFIGKYLKTDGTDGELGFGRPFTARPKTVRVWVKYRPATVASTEASTASSAGLDVKTGDLDQGIIYFALTDGSIMDAEYPEYPLVVKTKSKQFFDSERGDIIAYGKQIFDETSGEDMVMFDIPFEYYRTDVKPKYIIMCIAASRNGDYFVGGRGSNLWVDDIELLYE